MTKRTIDADALLDWVNRELRHAEKAIETAIFDKSSYRGIKSMAECTVLTINELATTALEPQESIFDAHVFNLKEESRHSQYWRPNDILISNQDTIIKLSADNFNCHKLRKLRNITAEQRCLYSKICELADRLDEKIQQESIFDAEGWCWDMDKAPVTAIGCLIKFFDILVLKKYHVRTQNECKQYERIADVWLDYELKLKDKDQQKLNIADVSILAWRPLPKTPKEA